MEVQLRRREFGFWRGSESCGDVLAEIAGEGTCDVLLFCPRPDAELPQVCAFLRAAIRLGADPAALTIVTPHPTLRWLEAVAARSLGLVGLEFRGKPGARPSDRWTVDSALQAICPELHSKLEGGEVLSVCGAHDDQMVVAAKQMGRWCMADYRCCSHRTRRSANQKRA